MLSEGKHLIGPNSAELWQIESVDSLLRQRRISNLHLRFLELICPAGRLLIMPLALHMDFMGKKENVRSADLPLSQG